MVTENVSRHELKSQDSDFYLMKDIMDSQTSREKTEKKYNFSRLVQKSQYFTDTLQIIDYTSLYLV